MLTLDLIKQKYLNYVWDGKNLPDKEDLDFLYNELNFSKNGISKFFNITSDTAKYYLSKLGIKKRYRFAVPDKEVLYDLYIVQNLTVSEVGKIIRKNVETTREYLNKYEIKKDISQVILTREKACLTKYGVKNPSQYDFVKKKKVDTCFKHFGVEYPSQSEYIRRKSKASYIKHCGKPHPNQAHISDESFAILSKKEELEKFIVDNKLNNTKDISSRLGIECVTLNRYIKRYGLRHLIKATSSSYEIELKNTFPEFDEFNIRKYTKPYEIDLYCSSNKVGVEVNGNYWHSSRIKSDKYHQNKSLLAKEKGVFLFHIFEYEWLDKSKKSIILSQLSNILGRNTNRLYARKCEIKEVSSKEERIFLDNNHLQGYCNSKVALGLYYNDELVSLMTFGKPRFNKKYEWELLRFCNKLNTSVVGGASKLFKYFIKEYKPASMLSYSNIAKTTGNMYQMLGFKYVGITQPNYVWVKGLKVLPRYMCTKSKLIKNGFSKDKTENQIMSELGFKKLYDCGNILWEFNTI